MVALQILRRDLIRYWRNPLRTLLLFSLPLVMTAIFALAFGSGGAESDLHQGRQKPLRTVLAEGGR
jgi:hypothetical protein